MNKTSNARGIIGAVLGLLVAVGVAQAEEISGTISITKVIFDDSQLVGDVTCTVTGAPCIQFGAPGITLKLNGFSITGLADPVTGCAGGAVGNENGISTNFQNNVRILGPGLVQRFRNNGIEIRGGSGAKAKGITASTNCISGILIWQNASENDVEENVLVRNGHVNSPCGGIELFQTTKNRIRRNVTGGNGYVQPLMGTPIQIENDFGIGLLNGANDNEVEENVVVGNTNGIRLVPTVTGNVVRENIVLGNPPLQVSNSFPTSTGVDIRNLAPAGANAFEDNTCATSINAPCPNFPELF